MSEHDQTRRKMLTGGLGLGALTLLPGMGAAQDDDVPASTAPDTKAIQEQPLERIGALQGAAITEKEGGFDVAPAAIQQISAAVRTFTFNLRDGDFDEQTSTVARPAGAGFVVFLNGLDYAFVQS